MKKLLTENGIVVGNVYNKYEASNRLIKWIMSSFYHDFFYLFDKVPHRKVYEAGCGEGYLSRDIKMRYPDIVLTASDFSIKILEKAKKIVTDSGVKFFRHDIYQVVPGERADLVIASEVLEHLSYPERALAALQKMSNPYCLMSVPREPIWRVLNILRGKYLNNFGNSPGHIQHWTTTSFLKVVSDFFDIIEVKTPLPFTIALCKTR